MHFRTQPPDEWLSVQGPINKKKSITEPISPVPPEEDKIGSSRHRNHLEIKHNIKVKVPPEILNDAALHELEVRVQEEESRKNRRAASVDDFEDLRKEVEEQRKLSLRQSDLLKNKFLANIAAP